MTYVFHLNFSLQQTGLTLHILDTAVMIALISRFRRSTLFARLCNQTYITCSIRRNILLSINVVEPLASEPSLLLDCASMLTVGELSPAFNPLSSDSRDRLLAFNILTAARSMFFPLYAPGRLQCPAPRPVRRDILWK